MNDKIWIQKTGWKTWKRCPGLFKYLFVENNPPSDGIELQFGRMFHDFAESFFDKINMCDLMHCHTLEDTVELFKPITIDQPVVKRWVDNFKLFEVSRWLFCRQRFPREPIKYWMPIATEMEIWVDKTNQLLHIDRLGWYDELSLVVIDYKSGKNFDPKELRPELTFYNIGVNACGKYQLPCLWLGAYNPQLNITFLERVSQRSTTAVMKSIYKMRDDIRNGNYPFKPSGLCRYCPRLSRCLNENVIPSGDEEMIEIGEENE